MSYSISHDALIDSINDTTNANYYLNVKDKKMVKIEEGAESKPDLVSKGYELHSKIEIKNILAKALLVDVENFDDTRDHVVSQINTSTNMEQKIDLLIELKEKIENELNFIQSKEDALTVPEDVKKGQYKKVAKEVHAVAKDLQETKQDLKEIDKKVNEKLRYYQNIYKKIEKFNSKLDSNIIVEFIQLRDNASNKNEEEILNSVINSCYKKCVNYLDTNLQNKNFDAISEMMIDLSQLDEEEISDYFNNIFINTITELIKKEDIETASSLISNFRKQSENIDELKVLNEECFKVFNNQVLELSKNTDPSKIVKIINEYLNFIDSYPISTDDYLKIALETNKLVESLTLKFNLMLDLLKNLDENDYHKMISATARDGVVLLMQGDTQNLLAIKSALDVLLLKITEISAHSTKRVYNAFAQTTIDINRTQSTLNNLIDSFNDYHSVIAEYIDIFNEPNALKKIDRFSEFAEKIQKENRIPPEFQMAFRKEIALSQNQLIKLEKISDYLKAYPDGVAYFVTIGSRSHEFNLHYNFQGPQVLPFKKDQKNEFSYENIKSSILEELIYKLQDSQILPSTTTGVAIHIDIHEMSATLIQSAARGYITRNRVILPTQLFPHLNNRLKNKLSLDQIVDISRAISREINTMSTDPEKHKGKSVRVSQHKVMEFPVFLGKDYQTYYNFTPYYDCWLEMSEKGDKIKLTMSELNKNSQVGKGGYKGIHKAESFEIDFYLEKGKRKGSYDPRVFVVPLNTSARSARITEGQEIQKKMLEKFKGIKIVEIPEARAPSADSSVALPEWTMPWYNADMEEAIKKAKVPVDIDKTTYTPYSFNDSLNALSTVGEAIVAMHEEGCVHRDLKALNILLKPNKQGELEGFLNDFDLACEMGSSKNYWNYEFWDPLSRRGIVTPATDLYGLALVLGDSLSPNFNKEFEDLNKFDKARLDHHKKIALSRLQNGGTDKEKAAVERSFEIIEDMVMLCKTIDTYFKQDPDLTKIFKSGTLDEKKAAWNNLIAQNLVPHSKEFLTAIDEVKAILK